ncbi:MAG: hypothetical protein FJY11_09035 [Bacteroidetes bacterium]|nr:hypothetical protein [Bacteroidota bacterium]
MQDARLAIYILEDLHKAGKIEALPSDEVVIEMAREISSIKRKRILDSRLRKIEELMVIDAFLKDKGIVAETDMEYAALINDNWDYSSGPERLSGYNLSAGLINRLETSRQLRSLIILPAYPAPGITYETHYNRYTYGVTAQLAYHKPIDLYWQLSAFAETSFYILQPFGEDDATMNMGLKGTQTTLSTVNISLTWFPDSRTSIEGSIYGSVNGSGSRYEPDEPADPEFITRRKTKAVFIYPGIQAVYYFSPRLTGTFSLNAEYNRSGIDTFTNLDPDGSRIFTSFLSGTINAGIVYSLF